MGMEIERKFCLSSMEPLEWLVQEGLRVEEATLCQVYTELEKEHQERYRFDGVTYTRTVKKGKGLVREETEEEVDEALFNQALGRAIGRAIVKKRYAFKLQNHDACIDVFEEELLGLVVLEVEFEDVDSAKGFVLPPFLNSLALEVTEDERYKNHRLALRGIPTEEVDVEALFAQAGQRALVVEELRPLMPSYEGLRIIFAELYAKIIFHKERYLATHQNEDLHQFRVNIRKTRSLLQCLPGLFDEGITARFIGGLKVLASQTNTKRDLDVFGEYLEGCTGMECIALHVKAFKEDQTKEIAQMLAAKSCGALLQEWRMVLEDGEGFFRGKNSTLSYRATGAAALKTRLEKLAKKLRKLDESKPLQMFHDVRIEFKRLRYLLEYFEPQFSSKTLKKAIKKTRAMQEVFGTLQDRDVQLGVLERLENHPAFCEDVESVAALEHLKENLRYEIYFLRLHILTQKKSLVGHLRQCAPLLEPYLVSL